MISQSPDHQKTDIDDTFAASSQAISAIMSDEEKHRLKELACKEIDSLAEELNKISEDIWNNPELGYEEKKAHGLLTLFLKSHGFQTEPSYKLDTAFKATYGNKDGGPNMCFISEYDALPEIGHACGHNLIAEVGVAAGCGLMAAMKSSEWPLGMVTVLGTPAEEGAGGKIDLIDAGAFDDVDVAMMAHPFPDNDSTPVFLARETLQVTFTGKPSHAAAFPWEGVNALDAAVTCYQALACLRQQTKPSWRIHCIVKEGGVKVNIIPERAVLHVAVRAPTDRELAQLKSKAIHCIQAGASASGCKVEWELFDKAYSSMMHNLPLVTLYEDNFRSQLPQSDLPCRKSGVCGSTDMGNVAHVVPGIHPNFSIGGSAVNHTRGFTADAGAPRAQPLALTQAKCLAMTAIDVMLDKDKLNEIQTSFKEALKLETGN